MALLKIFKPKHEHSDPKVRLDYVLQIEDREQELLAQIVSEESNSEIQHAALQKLSDLTILEELSTHSGNTSLKKEVSDRLETVYLSRILSENDLNQKTKYLDKISSEELHAEIAIKSPETAIRLKAIERISNQSLLLDVLSNPCGKEPGLAALSKMSDISLLEKAAKQASGRTVRALANDKLTQLRGPDSDQIKKQVERQIQQNLQEAKVLAHLPDPEIASRKFIPVLERWQQLNVQDTSDQARQFQDYSKTIQRRLTNFSKHKESEQQRKEQFDLLFSKLLDIFNELSELTDQTDSEFPENLKQLLNKWGNCLAQFEEPHLLPEESLSDYNCLKKANLKKAKVISAEREIFAQLQSFLDKITSSFQKESYSDIPTLLEKSHKLYSPDKFKYLAHEEIGENLTRAQSRFDEHKRLQDEERDKISQDNYDKLKSLLQEVVESKNSDNIPKAEKRIQEIQEIWVEITDLPPGSQEIQITFKDAVAQFKEACQNFYKENDWQLWTNKNLKEEMISDMRALNEVKDLHLVFKEMKSIQAKWNKIGDVPAKEENKLWRKFSKASDFNFKRCQIFFTELDSLAEENIQKKLSLIKQAEEHQESKEWNKSAEILKDLQKQWQEIGRVWKEKEDEIYAQFRKTCNTFFERRKEHYQKLADERLQNLDEKEKLCHKVEEIIQDPKLECGKEIQEIQKEWKKIGPVPKDKDEKIWKRFRHSCNQYYEWLDSLKPGNLKQKEELCQKAEELTETLDSQNTNLEKISRQLIAFQKEWKTIGPAQKPQEDEVWKRFRKICDTFFSIRKKHYDEIDRQRPINEEKKKEYIKQVIAHTKANDKKSVATIIRLQDEWKKIGPATKKNDGHLDKQFKEHCDTFFKARRHNFEELDRIRRENLKKKEELCVRLELLAGIGQEKTPRPTTNNALTLAEQLKLAFESNFVLSGEEKSSKRRKKDEIVHIQKEWDSILGEVPREHEYSIQKRYKRALKASQENAQTGNPKRKSIEKS